MEKLKQLLALTSGYKTYIAGLLAVVLGVYYQNVEMIMLGLVGMGLRAAIK